MKEVGFENIIVVLEEENLDLNFVGFDYLNLEEKKVLNRGILFVKEKGVDFVIVIDLDCDRVGVVVKIIIGEYVLFIGN